jgi:sialic acid synthase SpsE/spore coat polysaccharide biosynthesis protein SpsF (cytidylyltransferase family)
MNNILIAEIANSHYGNPDRLIHICEQLIDGGAKHIKFQIFKTESLVSKSHKSFDIFKSIEINENTWDRVGELLCGKDVNIYCDIFDEESLLISQKLNPICIKIHSSSISDTELIRKCATFVDKIILSTGGSDEEEIVEAISTIRKKNHKCEIFLMHGVQTFPTPLEDACLNEINDLKKRYDKYNVKYGLQEHIEGSNFLSKITPFVAIEKGYSLIEKHVTIDREDEGIDYYSSVNIDDFISLNNAFNSYFKICKDKMSEESINKYKLFAKKYAVAKNDIKKGQILSKNDICYKRVDKYFLSEKNIDEIIGLVATEDIPKESAIDKAKFKKVQNVGLVAVRLKSSRLKKKALLDVRGKPLIHRVYDNILKSKKVDKIIMCTSIDEEDDALCKYFKENKIDFYRGSRLDVIDRFLSCIESYNLNPKNIIRLTGDNCFTCTEEMDRLIESHNLEGSDYSTLTGLPSGANSEVISLDCLKKLNRIVEDGNSSEYMTWMLDDPEVFKVNKIECLDFYKSSIRLSCDTEEDFEVINYLFCKNISDVRSVIKNINKIKHIFKINSSVKQISKEEVIGLNIKKIKIGKENE